MRCTEGLWVVVLLGASCTHSFPDAPREDLREDSALQNGAVVNAFPAPDAGPAPSSPDSAVLKPHGETLDHPPDDASVSSFSSEDAHAATTDSPLSSGGDAEKAAEGGPEWSANSGGTGGEGTGVSAVAVNDNSTTAQPSQQPLVVLDAGPISDSEPTDRSNAAVAAVGVGSSEAGAQSTPLDVAPAAVPICGDKKVEGEEQCDEGLDNSDTGACTSACRNARCGDGLVQAGEEQCDDGRLTGAYGGCAPGCLRAPYCGDGIVQTVEVCDDGTEQNTGEYGRCAANCSLAPHCGDGVVQDYAGEVCDDADMSGLNGCGLTCHWSSGLYAWYRFNEGSGSKVFEELQRRPDGDVQLGRRPESAVPYEGAFRSHGVGVPGSYLHLAFSTGVDPTDPAVTNPIQFVNLHELVPSRNTTISIWARRSNVAPNTAPRALLWMGSDGNGSGGAETLANGDVDINHELWFREVSAKDDGTWRVNMGMTPSNTIDIAGDVVPGPIDLDATKAPNCDVSYTLTGDAWHHLVMTIEGFESKDFPERIEPTAAAAFYVDGRLLLTKNDCYTVNLKRFTGAFLGRFDAKDSQYVWMGDLDEFMLFSRVLTETEVLELYKSQSSVVADTLD